MLLKLGVSIARLIRQCRRALSLIDALYAVFAEEAVVTSTYEGSHAPGSLHYSNAAFDVRLSKTPPSVVLDRIKKALGKDFDVVLHGDHFHIEYDPKG